MLTIFHPYIGKLDMEKRKFVFLFLQIVSIFACFCIASQSIAKHSTRTVPSSYSTTRTVNNHHAMYFQLSTGVGIVSIGKTNDLTLNSLITNRYLPYRSNKAAFLFGGGFGYQWLARHYIVISLGLAGYYLNWGGAIRGTVQPTINIAPNFDTLNYAYDLTSGVLWAENRWTFGRHIWKPFLFLAIGSSWNNVSHYRETPTNPNSSAAAMAIPFQNNTNASFCYSAGVGLHYKDKLSFSYRYINTGRAKLGRTPTQTTMAQLSTDNVNGHFFILAFIF